MKNQLFEEVLTVFQTDYEIANANKTSGGIGLTKICKNLLSKLGNSRNNSFDVKSSEVFRNEKFIKKPLMNNHQGKCFKLQLKSLYPHVIKTIIERHHHLEFSHSIDELFMYCYHQRFEENDQSIKYKLLLHCCYGILSSDKLGITLSENVHTTFSNEIEKIVKTFIKYILVMDVDEIIVYKKSFLRELESIFPYFEITKYDDIYDALRSMPTFTQHRINKQYGDYAMNEKFHSSFQQ